MELKRTNLNDKITDTINDFNDNWANIEGSLELKANKQQEAWITPTLLNGWENHRSDYDDVGFMKDEFGFVHMKGMISKGTIGAVVFQLPMGYHPSKLITEFSRADNGVGYISITTLGTITISSHTGSWCTVNNICFKVGV